jgi:hypothetical protein
MCVLSTEADNNVVRRLKQNTATLKNKSLIGLERANGDIQTHHKHIPSILS